MDVDDGLDGRCMDGESVGKIEGSGMEGGRDQLEELMVDRGMWGPVEYGWIVL